MKLFFFSSFALLGGLLLSCGKEQGVQPAPGGKDTTKTTPPAVTVSRYLTAARETHGYALANLLTPYNSYKVSTVDPTSAFEWYNASQMYADAALIRAGDTSAVAQMNRTFNWMNAMWDEVNPEGGYYGFVRIDGTGKGTDPTKYTDDNALTGMAYLDAYEVTTGPAKAAYLTAAKACAGYLIKSGLWDTTLGGGFWWNTQKNVKPTQSNGLTLQLFAKLYTITADPVYLDWANRVNTWLASRLYESSTGLFIWQQDNTGKKFTQKFTYDNAIMVEAFLLYGQALNDEAYLAKAQALGNAINSTLWDKLHNVYLFNTSDPRINPAWCGWGSQAMIKLYEADHNSSWLGYAQGNIDAINTVLKDPVTKGYYNFAALDGAGRYTNIEGVDVAWMQRVQALISLYR